MTNQSDKYIIEAKKICKSYRMGQTTVQVLKDLDFAVKAGEFVAVIGSSGSGKSTLLHLLGALDKPDSGAILFEGKDINSFSSAKANEFRNKKAGFVFQFYHLLDELNVLENVLLPAMSANVLKWFAEKKQNTQKALSLLEQLGLADRIRHKPYQLSGGERQRTAIARALINNPAILLADEPTGNLDFQTGNGILDVLENFNRQGQTIVMVTHDSKIAGRAGRIVTLQNGKIIQ